MPDLTIIGTYSVFTASYVVFALGKFPGMKIDRPGAAIIGAVLMFTTGAVRADNALHLVPLRHGCVALLDDACRSLPTLGGLFSIGSPIWS